MLLTMPDLAWQSISRTSGARQYNVAWSEWSSANVRYSVFLTPTCRQVALLCNVYSIMHKKVGGLDPATLSAVHNHIPHVLDHWKTGIMRVCGKGVRVTWARADLALPMETSDAHAAGTFALLHLIYTYPLKNCWRERKGGAKGCRGDTTPCAPIFSSSYVAVECARAKARKCNKEGRCSPEPVHGKWSLWWMLRELSSASSWRGEQLLFLSFVILLINIYSIFHAAKHTSSLH